MWRHRRLDLPPPLHLQVAVVTFPHLGAQQNTTLTVLFSVPFTDITSKSDMTNLATCESMVRWKQMRTWCVAEEGLKLATLVGEWRASLKLRHVF